MEWTGTWQPSPLSPSQISWGWSRWRHAVCCWICESLPQARSASAEAASTQKTRDVFGVIYLRQTLFLDFYLLGFLASTLHVQCWNTQRKQNDLLVPHWKCIVCETVVWPGTHTLVWSKWLSFPTGMVCLSMEWHHDLHTHSHARWLWDLCETRRTHPEGRRAWSHWTNCLSDQTIPNTQMYRFAVSEPAATNEVHLETTTFKSCSCVCVCVCVCVHM